MAITMNDIYERARQCGVYVSTWAPGDGYVRVRLHDKGQLDRDGRPIGEYFAGNVIATFCGKGEAHKYLAGLHAGLRMATAEGADASAIRRELFEPFDFDKR